MPHWPRSRRLPSLAKRRKSHHPSLPNRLFQTFFIQPYTYASDLGQFSGSSVAPLSLGSTDGDAIESELYSYLSPVRRRLWMQRSLLLMIRALAIGAVGFAIARFLEFAAIPVDPTALWVLWAIIALWTVVLIARQRISFSDAARVVDRRMALGQVVGTGVELITAGADTRLARLQVRKATEAARQIDSAEAIGLRLPGRDFQAIIALGLVALLFGYLSTLTIQWPGTSSPEELASAPAEDLLLDAPYSDPYIESTLDPALVGDPFSSQMDGYISELDGQNLSEEELAQRVAELQAQLSQRAEAINRQQQALATLADALRDSSATSGAAESIRRGDYSRASEALAQVGSQSSQLSPRARQDLAQRLTEAASRVAATNPELAERMRQSAQALTSNDPAAASQALAQLGEQLNQEGEQLQSLADSSQPFDPSEFPSSSAESGELQAEGSPGMSGYEGSEMQSGTGEFDEIGEFEEGFRDSQAAFQDGNAGAADAGSGTSDSGTEQAGAASGAGAGSGESSQYQPPSPNRTTATGRILELHGRPADGGASSSDNTGQVPLVASNDGSVAEGGAAGGRTILDPLSVRAEQNFVPWDKRQVVRDYFTDQTR